MKKEFISLSKSEVQDLLPFSMWDRNMKILSVNKDGLGLGPGIGGTIFFRAIDTLPFEPGRYSLDVKFKFSTLVPDALNRIYIGIMFPKPHSGGVGTTENEFQQWYGQALQFEATVGATSINYGNLSLSGNAGDINDAAVAYTKVIDQEYLCLLKMDLALSPKPLNVGEPPLNLGARSKFRGIFNTIRSNSYGDFADTLFSEDAIAIAVVGCMGSVIDREQMRLISSNFRRVDEVREPDLSEVVIN